MSEQAPSPAPSSPAESKTPPLPEIRLPLAQFLLVVTGINFALIFGGTLYSQLTVNSIQKTYHEAEARLNESKTKYFEASSSLQEQRGRAEKARSELDSALKRLDQLDTVLAELKKEGFRKLDAIANDARAQLTQLKSEHSSIGAALVAFEADTRAAITAKSTRLQTELESHLRDSRRDMDSAKGKLDSLKTEIGEQTSEIAKRELEIQTFQLSSNRTLENVRETDKKLKAELVALQQNRSIDIEILWQHSSPGLRGTFVTTVVVAFLALFASLWRIAKRKSSVHG